MLCIVSINYLSLPWCDSIVSTKSIRTVESPVRSPRKQRLITTITIGSPLTNINNKHCSYIQCAISRTRINHHQTHALELNRSSAVSDYNTGSPSPFPNKPPFSIHCTHHTKHIPYNNTKTINRYKHLHSLPPQIHPLKWTKKSSHALLHPTNHILHLPQT